ncbi:hypothetical protein PHJA_001956200, partial [Phtheirospermum japonicum]
NPKRRPTNPASSSSSRSTSGFIKNPKGPETLKRTKNPIPKNSSNTDALRRQYIDRRNPDKDLKSPARKGARGRGRDRGHKMWGIR